MQGGKGGALRKLEKFSLAHGPLELPGPDDGRDVEEGTGDTRHRNPPVHGDFVVGEQGSMAVQTRG